MEKKKRNKIYRKALDLNVNWNGYDDAFRYMKSEINMFYIKKYRHQALPELEMFDEKINYDEHDKRECMKIRDIALMFCIEMTNQ